VSDAVTHLTAQQHKHRSCTSGRRYRKKKKKYTTEPFIMSDQLQMSLRFVHHDNKAEET
jgi:hypothetical protein